MTRSPLIAIALAATLGTAAPALASNDEYAPHNAAAPFCSNGSGTDLSSREQSLATQLKLDTNPHATISESNGCLKVTTVADGKVTMTYYDPDSFAVLAKIS